MMIWESLISERNDCFSGNQETLVSSLSFNPLQIHWLPLTKRLPHETRSLYHLDFFLFFIWVNNSSQKWKNWSQESLLSKNGAFINSRLPRRRLQKPPIPGQSILRSMIGLRLIRSWNKKKTYWNWIWWFQLTAPLGRLGSQSQWRKAWKWSWSISFLVRRLFSKNS